MFDLIINKLRVIYVDNFDQIIFALTNSLLLILGVLLVEVLIVGWRSSSLYRLTCLNYSVQSDILSFFMVNVSISLLMGTAMLFGIAYAAEYMVKYYLKWQVLDYNKYPLITYAIYLIGLDLSNYWIHRAMHTYRPLWCLHRYHHSSTEMTMFNALRDHPMERAFSHLANAFPAAILGLPPQHYVIAHLIFQMHGYLKHSNIKNNWGFLGKWIFQSPAAHWVHHANDPRFYNTNFATKFQWWDVMFGTSYHPAAEEVKDLRLGVAGDNGNRPPFHYMGEVVVNFYSAIKKNVQAWKPKLFLKGPTQ